MSLLDTMRARRSVKEFDPEHRLTDAELRQLLTAIALAPTSFNMQNRHVVVVTDPDVKAELKAASWNQAQVGNASVVLVMAGDLTSHRNTDRYLRDAPEQVRTMFRSMIPEFYEGKDELIRDEACRTIGLAAMNAMLMAKDMGLDSCPMIGFDPARVSEIVGLDADHPPLMMVVVGKATQPARGRMGLLDMEELFSLDRYGNAAITGVVEG